MWRGQKQAWSKVTCWVITGICLGWAIMGLKLEQQQPGGWGRTDPSDTWNADCYHAEDGRKGVWHLLAWVVSEGWCHGRRWWRDFEEKRSEWGDTAEHSGSKRLRSQRVWLYQTGSPGGSSALGKTHPQLGKERTRKINLYVMTLEVVVEPGEWMG